MVIFLVDVLLVFNCLSVTSTSALVPETFRPASYTPNTLVSTTRFLRESGVPAEIEKIADAVIKGIAEAHVEPQTKRRKVSHDVTSEHEYFLHSRRQKTARDLFDHEEIQRWIENVNKAKAEHPESEISVLPTLVKYFGNEELFKILEVAATDPKYASLAKNLLAEQVHYWMKTNKAPDEVFDLLGLGKTGSNILENPKFLGYVTYFNQFRAKNPEQPTSMVTTILKHQSAADLIRQINDEKTSKSKKVQKVAKGLEKDLIEHLVQTQSLDEALEALDIDFFAHVILHRDTLKSICSKLLVGYIPKQIHTDTKVADISKLVERFGEDLVVLSIVTTNADHEVGVELRSVLLQYWLSKRKSIPDVAKLLGEPRDWKKRDSLTTQTGDLWISYMDYRVEKEPDKINSLLIDLGTILKPNDLYRFFLRFETYPNVRRAMEKSPLTMFEELKLAENHEAVIDNPTFPIWLAYKESYERRHPYEAEKSLAVIFYYHFGSERVPELLDKLQEVLKDNQSPLARSGLLSFDDVSIWILGESEDWKHVPKAPGYAPAAP
ncbi:hypothetical protein PsorP6_010313 [Peronosclerospora sorghi]|uniref:Uncharacterized protein n=1 Tax=Peronosclerospora sorghi TaxID=230839 RepID=A0ACC0VU06_9STRA|nr:hypothetical protein PsorP6_010313 [Peronosclerospora sorghi]